MHFLATKRFLNAINLFCAIDFLILKNTAHQNNGSVFRTHQSVCSTGYSKHPYDNLPFKVDFSIN